MRRYWFTSFAVIAFGCCVIPTARRARGMLAPFDRDLDSACRQPRRPRFTWYCPTGGWESPCLP